MTTGIEEFEQANMENYDDSPWTREELHALGWEAGKAAAWEEMAEYENAAEPDEM